MHTGETTNQILGQSNFDGICVSYTAAGTTAGTQHTDNELNSDCLW